MKGTIYINNEAQDQSTETDEALVKDQKSSEETKSENISEGKLSPYIEKFLDKFEERLRKPTETEGNTLKVSEVLGGLARLYERVRTTIEYKGEHVLRRNAIERILKRRVWEQGSIVENIDERKIAEFLVKELIWARYLPNDSVTRSKLEKLANVIGKYLYLFRNLDNFPANFSQTTVRTWVWGVASSEIEDVLDPSNRELYVKLMFDWFTDRFNWIDSELDQHNKDIQIYLAIHRAHTKSDEPIMRYHLLMTELPDWKNAGKNEINKLILEFPKIYAEIEDHLSYHGRFSLYRRVQKHSAAFDIFHEIALQEKLNLRTLMEDKEKFIDKIRLVCEKKYRLIRQKVNTGIVRSIIYIFLTKVIFAMLIEIPYEIFMYSEVRYLPLSINIIFPPFMMWVIGMSTKIPGAKNTEKIIERLESAVYPVENKNVQNFSVAGNKRTSALSSLFGLIYLILFLLVFGGISYLLSLIDFSLSGLIVFFAFMSLVTLFAFRVRFNAVQLKIDTEEETFFGHLASYLMLPFLNFGFYLSRGLAKINFLSIILDFIIEAPLKSIIGLFEEWTSFIREKKEEVIELPE